MTNSAAPETAPIHMSESAVAAAIELARDKPDFRNLPVRIYIAGKGCDGFTYGVSFDERSDRDVTWQVGTLTVVVDPESLRFLAGSVVDWVDDERGRGFLVSNPSHEQFRGKFYRKPDWQARIPPVG